MTSNPAMNFQHLTAANASARFNSLAGFEVIAAGDGAAEIRMPWRDDFTQYAGHLHAGMIAALLDTACGFAAASMIGPVTASYFSMNCLKPAVGRFFVAKARQCRPGANKSSQRPNSSPKTNGAR
jgi:uncharacterized protein (TIGR00369 family)